MQSLKSGFYGYHNTIGCDIQVQWSTLPTVAYVHNRNHIVTVAYITSMNVHRHFFSGCVFIIMHMRSLIDIKRFVNTQMLKIYGTNSYNIANIQIHYYTFWTITKIVLLYIIITKYIILESLSILL